MADINPGLVGGQETLVSVRDRLFHTLFVRLSLGYARAFNATARRLIETVFLLKAITCFMLLIYIHMAFARHPIQCLEHLKTNWPRDGILRVEIINNPHENYNLNDSYEKEREIQAIQKRKEELAIFGIFAPEGHYDEFRYEIDGEEKSEAENIEVEKAEAETSEVNWEMLNVSSTIDLLYPQVFNEFDKEGSSKAEKYNGNISLLEEALQKTEDVVKPEKHKIYVNPDLEYIVEYSLEYGFLRLSPTTRQKLNITVTLIVLDPSKETCFRDSFSQFMLEHFLGYEDVLMSSVKSLAEHEASKGYLRNVVTGAHYHFVSKWTSSTSYFTAAIVMIIFTVSITMLLRYSQHQIFIFIVELLQMLEFNTALAFPAAPLLTVILALVGMEAIMSEFFDDTTTAFYIILTVWIADQYDAICCHTNTTKKYWLRFFYLYHLFFYAYHYRFSGQYSGLALLTMWLFTHHSMLYFFHHYELPFIIHQTQLQDMLMRNQDAGGPPLRFTQRLTVIHPNNNNNNTAAVNRNNVRVQNTLPGTRRTGTFNFGGFRFRFGIVFTTTTTLTTSTTTSSATTTTTSTTTTSTTPNVQAPVVPQNGEESMVQLARPEANDVNVINAGDETVSTPIQTVASTSAGISSASSSDIISNDILSNDIVSNDGFSNNSDPPTSSSNSRESNSTLLIDQATGEFDDTRHPDDIDLSQVVEELRVVSQALKLVVPPQGAQNLLETRASSDSQLSSDNEDQGVDSVNSTQVD